jgi:hypothetical protein
VQFDDGEAGALLLVLLVEVLLVVAAGALIAAVGVRIGRRSSPAAHDRTRSWPAGLAASGAAAALAAVVGAVVDAGAWPVVVAFPVLAAAIGYAVGRLRPG